MKVEHSLKYKIFTTPKPQGQKCIHTKTMSVPRHTPIFHFTYEKSCTHQITSPSVTVKDSVTHLIDPDAWLPKERGKKYQLTQSDNADKFTIVNSRHI